MKSEIQVLEEQLADFTNMFIHLTSQIQTEESRDKAWELTSIMNDIENQIQELKDQSKE